MKTWVKHNPVSAGFLLAGIGTVLFSCKGVLIKLAYQQGATPDVVMALRMLISFPFYAVIAVLDFPRGSLQLTLHNGMKVAVFGLLGYYLASILDVYGLVYVSASLERIILYTYPVMVFLLTVAFLNVRFQSVMLLIIAIIYGGLVIVFINQPDIHLASSRQQLLHGTALVLASALCYSIYLVGTETMIRIFPNRFYTACAMLSASVAMLVHGLLRVDLFTLLHQTTRLYWLCVLIAIFCTVLPSFFVSAGIQRIGATKAGVVGNIGPLVTLVLGTLLLGESVTLLQLAGFGIVIGGVYWLSQHKS